MAGTWISTTSRPILVPKDFDGIRIRLPAGQMFTDTFRALGAEPVTINVNQIYDGIKNGKVDGDNLSFSITASFQGNEVEINYTGKVSSDGKEIKFKAEVSAIGQTVEYTVKKIS